MRICHITTAHPRYDVRIFLKECQSLAKRYPDVHLIVADGKGDEVKDGVHIHDIGKPSGRRQRMLAFPKLAFHKALEINADAYHFHDPELLPTGVRLRKKGKLVVYDSHEDLPRQILTKPWIPKLMRGSISCWMERFENKRVRKLSAVVAATPHIQDRFWKVTGAPVENVNNYPILSEITVPDCGLPKEKCVCYVGGIFVERGIYEMVRATQKSDARLLLAGSFSPESLESEVAKEQGWAKTDFLGFLNRQEINELLGKSMAGLLLLHPMPSYKESLPIKMFEYMAAGIPVICSDFALWKGIVEGGGCGICLNPFDTEQVAEKINWLLAHPEVAKEMGDKGRQLVETKYNWNTQEAVLFQLYETLFEQHSERFFAR